MSRPHQPEKPRAAPIFNPPPTPAPANPIPSSSPAFATPAHPIRPFNAAAVPTRGSILPILLPPATLRPLAFRTFTKKHSLTLTSSALQVLATFVGRQCGTGWREEGLAERVLEEVARSWKNQNGGVIVDGEGDGLKEILKNLEGSMSGGRIVQPRELSRQNSLGLGSSQEADVSHARLGLRPQLLGRDDSQSSLGVSTLDVNDDDDGDEGSNGPRKWLKVIDAFEQPRLIYNVGQKHFDRFVAVIPFGRANSNPNLGTLGSRHCYPRPLTKRKFSGIDIISFINDSFEMNLSRGPHLSQQKLRPYYDRPPL
jgi:DNA polymerase epsilon subunit 2